MRWKERKWLAQNFFRRLQDLVWTWTSWKSSQILSRERKSESGWANWRWAFIGLLGLFNRPDPWVRDGKGRRYDLDLMQAVIFPGRQNDPGNAGVNGQGGHDPAVAGQSAGGINGPEFGQEFVAITDGIGVRRFHKGERVGRAEVEGDHLEDDLGQIGPFDLGQGELLPPQVIFFGKRRTQMPGPIRPQRPLRWSQLALDILVMGRLMVLARTLYWEILARPASTT